MSFEDDEYWDEEYADPSPAGYAVVRDRAVPPARRPDIPVPRRPVRAPAWDHRPDQPAADLDREPAPPVDELAARRRRRSRANGRGDAPPGGGFDAARPGWLDDPDFQPIDTTQPLAESEVVDFNRPELGADFDNPEFPGTGTARNRRGVPDDFDYLDPAYDDDAYAADLGRFSRGPAPDERRQRTRYQSHPGGDGRRMHLDERGTRPVWAGSGHDVIDVWAGSGHDVIDGEWSEGPEPDSERLDDSFDGPIRPQRGQPSRRVTGLQPRVSSNVALPPLWGPHAGPRTATPFPVHPGVEPAGPTQPTPGQHPAAAAYRPRARAEPLRVSPPAPAIAPPAASGRTSAAAPPPASAHRYAARADGQQSRPHFAADLAAIRWRLDGGTLREVVDDPEALRALGARLDGSLAQEGDTVAQAGLLSVRAEVYRLLGELGLAAAASRLALAHAESARDMPAIVIAQAELAHVLRLRGDFAEADRLFEQAAGSGAPRMLRSVVHENAGRSCFDQGRLMEALDHFARAMRLGAPDDLDLAERIGVSLEAVYIHALRDGWGPYPRPRRETLGRTRPPGRADQRPAAPG
ncbi:MAG TPA: tetratricopeptide repeat protein [Actinoplanes sp.]|nr:tetratricopeptide repeat protein [Actinoplanes sp.]